MKPITNGENQPAPRSAISTRVAAEHKVHAHDGVAARHAGELEPELRTALEIEARCRAARSPRDLGKEERDDERVNAETGPVD